MKTLTFKYTKKDNSVSERLLLAMVQPTDKFAGIDVTQLDGNEAAEFIALANTLHSEYLAKMGELQDRFDLKHNYRQFLASGVTNLEEI